MLVMSSNFRHITAATSCITSRESSNVGTNDLTKPRNDSSCST